MGKTKRKSKITASKLVFNIVTAIFAVYAIVLLIPMVYGFTISLKENGRAFMQNPVSFAPPFYFNNYIKAFDSLSLGETRFFDMLFNSPLILIASYSGFSMYFIYIYAFFKSISWSYAESAFIDGAGNLRVFFSIMVPMLLPSITALAIMSFIGAWNDYAGTLLWLPNMPILASGLFTYEANMRYTANQPVYFAGVFLSILPVVTIFFIFQNTIMSNVYAGGLKG